MGHLLQCASLVAQRLKRLPASACNAGELGSVPGSGNPGEGNGNPLQYSCLRIPLTEKSNGPQSMGSQGVRHNLATKQQGNEEVRGEVLPNFSNKAGPSFPLKSSG